MLVPRSIPFLKRLFSTSTTAASNSLQQLTERSLIKVNGPDVSDFLQGLITNDIHHLSNGVGSMFTMFLNIKGRVLYDALVYKTHDNDQYFIECDTAIVGNLQKHLKMYKVKRKVDVSVLDDYRVYALFNSSDIINQECLHNDIILIGDYNSTSFPENSTDVKIHKDLLIFKDPRVQQLGFRILTKINDRVKEMLQDLVECETTSNYKQARYSLGVGEGISDLPVGNSFPLECNCDYLHGVSFHKGCYIGQELTARTYHTGVIRKRLMPLLFTKTPTNLPENSVIEHNGTNLGKLRGIECGVGLALLRVTQALSFEHISVGDGNATVIKPKWWPIELPKEKLNVHTIT